MVVVIVIVSFSFCCSSFHKCKQWGIKGGRTLEVLTPPLTTVKVEPKEHHRKTRLTKNEKMTIALAEVMARSTTDLSDTLLKRWQELRRCFPPRTR